MKIKQMSGCHITCMDEITPQGVAEFLCNPELRVIINGCDIALMKETNQICITGRTPKENGK